MLPRASLCRKKLYAEKTKQTPGPYALAVSGPQPVRCHPVCAGPFVETVRRSVTDTMGRHFVGLANYTAVLGNDAFRLAVENTVRFIGYAFRCCWRSVWHWLWRYGRKA